MYNIRVTLLIQTHLYLVIKSSHKGPGRRSCSDFYIIFTFKDPKYDLDDSVIDPYSGVLDVKLFKKLNKTTCDCKLSMIIS